MAFILYAQATYSVFSWKYCAPMPQCLPGLFPSSLLIELTLTTDSWLCSIFRLPGRSSCDSVTLWIQHVPPGWQPWDCVWQTSHYREHLWPRTQLLCSEIYGCISAMATSLIGHVQSTLSTGRWRQTHTGRYRILHILAVPHWLPCIAAPSLDYTAVQETCTPLPSLSLSLRDLNHDLTATQTSPLPPSVLSETLPPRNSLHV